MRKIVAAFICLGALVAYAQEIPISKDAREVLPAAAETFEVELKDIPASKQAVLYVTAWIATPKFLGYAGAMKVYWNGEPLTKLVSRPTVLKLADGRTQPALAPSLGWVVPYIDDPDSYADQKQSPYFLSEEGVNPAVFAFALPEVFDGRQEVSIESSLEDPKRVLHVRDIFVRFEDPKE